MFVFSGNGGSSGSVSVRGNTNDLFGVIAGLPAAEPEETGHEPWGEAEVCPRSFPIR